MAIILTTDDTRREVFLKAEQAKIHTGSILPQLDNPASTGDVLKDKDYINGDGDKKIGTLIITDTVQDDGYFGNNGYGVSVNLVSVLDRSTKILELPEPNLAAENIVQGKSIFGVSGTAKLPTLDNPASIGDVIAGKEYIDGAGAKRVGTLVVCDTIKEVESHGEIGIGVEVEIESSADGSRKTMMLTEPNLKSENIVSGVSIFGIAGSAKTMRVESGTITPAEDMTTLSVPCSNNPKYAVISTTPENTVNGDIIGAVIYNINYDGLFAGNCIVSYYYSSKIRSTISVAAFDTGINIPAIATCFYRAGTAYQWTAYYWEDDA